MVIEPQTLVDVLALAGATMAQATDGRGIRGARVEARNRLVRLGYQPLEAGGLVAAIEGVARTIRATAARGQA